MASAKAPGSTPRPRIGVSACLVGERVRYDGEHKRQTWIVEKLAKMAELVPFCPEVAMGLGVPRPTVRLVKREGELRMLVHKSDEDLTELARATGTRLARGATGLDGFILKKDSPSCGLERVKVYGPKPGAPARIGQGFFAAALREREPWLPMIEEGRLTDPEQRDNFLLQVFAYARLKQVPARMSAIQEFHRAYKLVLMAHSPGGYTKLGRVIGNQSGLAPREVLDAYSKEFMQALGRLPTVKSRTNALQHALGFLRGQADEVDRKQLAEAIEQFRLGELPFIAPLTVLHHLVRKLKIAYLEEQTFFRPFPRGTTRERAF